MKVSFFLLIFQALLFKKKVVVTNEMTKSFYYYYHYLTVLLKKYVSFLFGFSSSIDEKQKVVATDGAFFKEDQKGSDEEDVSI